MFTPSPIVLLLDLFESVPHVMVCVKDRDGRYTEVNQAFVRRARCRRAADVIGRRAADLFPADLAASYDAQDRALQLTGLAVRNHLETIAGMGGDRADQSRWYLTTKVTADDPEHGRVVVAVSADAQLGDRSHVATGLRAAVELAHARFDEALRVDDLALAANMSSDRLERAMRRVLNVSPKQYILRLRADRAAQLLTTTDRSIADIAAGCGYYDQSQLTRQFRDHHGLTPARYRATAGA